MSHGFRKSVSVILIATLAGVPTVQGYEFIRSNPINRTDPSGLFSLPDFLAGAAIRTELAATSFAGAHPLAMRFVGGLLAAANLYAFAQYQEVQAIVLSQPNPMGFLAGEAAALRLALRDLTSTAGSITALARANAATRGMVNASRAFVSRATLSFKPFTRSNFRQNLGILTGGVRQGFDAHHVFPVKFIEKFQAKGIDIHDPIYGAWWEWRVHRGGGKAYNDKWKLIFQTSPSREQILQRGRELGQSLGFEIHF